jgi:hypothetical protein
MGVRCGTTGGVGRRTGTDIAVTLKKQRAVNRAGSDGGRR